jgi:hypothetical protein
MKYCEIANCDREAKWMPVLEFRAGENYPPTIACLAMGVCTWHKERTTAEDYLTDQGFNKLSEAIRAKGHELPKRSLTTIRFEKLIDEPVMMCQHCGAEPAMENKPFCKKCSHEHYDFHG